MGLDIYRETKGTRINRRFLDMIYKSALNHFELSDIFEIEISIVTEETIQNTNKHTRGIDKVTDVLSFPICNFVFPFKKEDYRNYIDPESGNIMLGEIMLCEKRAQEQAEEYGHSFNREVGFLVLHGILHLLGFDHIEKDDEVIMMGHAEKILEGLDLKRNV